MNGVRFIGDWLADLVRRRRRRYIGCGHVHPFRR
jgi:hypothetical protein